MANYKLTQSGNQIQSDLDFVENIFETFSTSKAYVVGDIVRYGDNLFRAIHNSSAGAFVPANWEDADISTYSDRFTITPVEVEEK